jgi:TolB-like protein/Tfp pilus assembly protein PilF/predicted Ser/Thr protein kinase
VIGKTISHYRIIEKLGEGGMGVVYKAEDLSLERPVALKFLSARTAGTEEDASRFVHEAKAAASLNHPNICTIYEIGEDDGRTFIAMECVEGENLRARMQKAPLPLDEALTIAADIARGLAAAHEKGIVHRDIKPANIVVTPTRMVKIMDFGLARVAGGAHHTRAGTTVGTVAYMSPEQARGEDVDHRTDIWSLGVVLYEMLTGRRPFPGDRDMAVIYSILNTVYTEPTDLRPDLPQELDGCMRKMLAKRRDDRYGSALEVAGDLFALLGVADSGLLTRSIAVATRAQPSVAVLPFANLSADPEQEYFCDGMAEEIINSLTHLDGMRVVARTSSFAFKGKNEDAREMGRQLGVATLLEGSVRRAGNRLRVTTQLVNVSDGCHLWSERFDREMEDVFAIQDEISLAVTNALKVRLLGADKAKVVKRHTVSFAAYRAYMKGRYHWFIRSSSDIEKAIGYLEEAVAIDPEYALAYAGLADCYGVLPMYRPISPDEVYPRAKAAAMKALELDDSLAEAHAALSCIMENYEWDWAGSDREIERAIELNPGYATAYQWKAEDLITRGRFDEAVEVMNKARELDPLSLFMNARVGMAFYYARRYDDARVMLETTLEVDPTFDQARYFLSLVYAIEDRYEEAIDLITDESFRAWGAMLHAWNGDEERARAVMDETLSRGSGGYDWPSVQAGLRFALGDVDGCFEWMERAVDVKDPRLPLMMRSPKTDPLRDDPRFAAILERMGLEP